MHDPVFGRHTVLTPVMLTFYYSIESYGLFDAIAAACVSGVRGRNWVLSVIQLTGLQPAPIHEDLPFICEISQQNSRMAEFEMNPLPLLLRMIMNLKTSVSSDNGLENKPVESPGFKRSSRCCSPPASLAKTNRPIALTGPARRPGLLL